MEESSSTLHLESPSKKLKKDSKDKKELKKLIEEEQKKIDKVLRKKKKAEKKTRKAKKKKLKIEKKEKKIKKLLKKKQKLDDKLKEKEMFFSNIVIPNCNTNDIDYNVIKNDDENISKSKAPMTKEEWEAQQSVIRKVFDPETGRFRLVKGSGEILEECVSRARHKEINKIATKGDGIFYQSTIMSKIKRV